jgi:ATPases of the AAA+ class
VAVVGGGAGSEQVGEPDGDQADDPDDVTVLAATNAPEAIDSALLRPGRFERVVAVGLPTRAEREQMLRRWRARMEWAEDVDTAGLAQRTERYSGADIAALCRRAAVEALVRHDADGAPPGDAAGERAHSFGERPKVHAAHFEAALALSFPSVGAEQLARFKSWRAP